MGHDMTTRMGATMPVWAIEGETPEEGSARDKVPYVTMDEFHEKTRRRWLTRSLTCCTSSIGQRPAEMTPERAADAFNALADKLVRDGVVGVKDGKLITADEMYIGLPVHLLEVTDEMRRIGGDILRQCREQEVFHEQAAEAAFRLMYANQRVPLVSDAEIALTRERDAAIVNRNQLNDAYFRMVGERDEYAEQHRLAIAGLVYRASEAVALRAELMAAHEVAAATQIIIDTLADRLQIRCDQVTRLQGELAKLTSHSAKGVANTDALSNAIREHGSDRRMVGR